LAIFLDMENLFGGYAGNVAGVQIGKVVRGIEQIVRSSGIGQQTATVRAYANWGRSDMAVYQREMLEYGVEPVQIFSFNKNVKNAADIELCVDVLEVAHDSPWVEVFVIVSGDGGFVPLIRRLHYLNKYAIVVSTNDANAGDVNPLLKSVADEYHQIDVSGVLAAVSTESFGSATEPETSVVPPSIVTRPKSENGSPAAPVLRAAIIELSKKDSQVLIDGQVNAAALGSVLRSKWPLVDYSKYGSRNLAGFVEKQCGLTVYRPVAPKSDGSKSKPPALIRAIKTRDEYMAAVRGLFTDGDLGLAVRDHESRGVGLPQIGAQLRNSIPSYSSADSGFPRLYMVLQYALSGTAYHVVRFEDKSLAVVHVDHLDYSDALPHLMDRDLKSPELVRMVLGQRMPAVLYPGPLVLSDVLRVVLAVPRPYGLAEFIDFVADALPAVPAETVRLTLGLLLRVGVLTDDGGADRMVVKPGLVTESAALRVVVDDAVRRAAEIQWPVTEEDLLEALY